METPFTRNAEYAAEGHRFHPGEQFGGMASASVGLTADLQLQFVANVYKKDEGR